MKTCHLRAGCAALIFSASCAPGRADMIARDLLQDCRQMETQGRIDGSKISMPDKAASGICVGFFSAVVGATLFRAADDSPLLGICTPDHVSTYDLIRATEHFVEVNPETDTQRAIVVILSAAKQAYPCDRARKASATQ